MTKKRTVYFSWNATEHARLAGASHDEVVMYLTILKPLANFKTGVVGSFNPKQPVTYARLGELLGRPATQGRPAVQYDGTQAKRVLERLVARGLVADMHVVGGGLIACLPLSPIAPTQRAGKLSDEASSERREIPPQTADSVGFPTPSTVLIDTEPTDQSRREKPNTDQAAAPLPSVEGGEELAAEAEVDDDNFMPFDDTPPRYPKRGQVAI